MEIIPPTNHLYGDILGAGAIVGSYVVDALACEGGFAAIYRAHHIRTQAPAALKVLRNSLADSWRMLERFHQEAEAIRRVRHPNLVEIYEIDESPPGRPYIAMEWLDGRHLASELEHRGPFTAHEAIAILTEICGALSAVHRAGVIHRDIKASNAIAVPRENWFTIKLIDFGIAKLVAPSDVHSALTTRTMLGTPRTMAPEQILGQEVDARTDIYALGLLLYQLMCGRLPFDSENPVELEQFHLHAVPPRASEAAPVPQALDAVILRALSKQPADRHSSVDDFLADAQGALATTGRSQSHPPDSESTLAIGVAIETRTAMPDSDRHGDREDDMLAQIEDVLARGDEFVTACGLIPALATSTSLIAVMPLPSDGAAQKTERLRIMNRVSDFYHVCRAVLATPLITIHITIHVAGMLIRRHGSAIELVGGPLLELGRWPRSGEEPGISFHENHSKETD